MSRESRAFFCSLQACGMGDRPANLASGMGLAHHNKEPTCLLEGKLPKLSCPLLFNLSRSG